MRFRETAAAGGRVEDGHLVVDGWSAFGVEVCAVSPDGGLALPTGQVFIRFKEGVQVEEHAEKIRNAGYEIAQSVSYAPHAAWLRPNSGDVADGLAKIPALEKIPDVENVEPQMLRPRANR